MRSKRRISISAEERERTKGYREQIRSWRQHPDDPWAELERLDMTEDVLRLGWTQPRVTRAMNSVASEERFRLKIHLALQSEDKPLHIAGGIGRPGTPEEDHGYTRNPGRSLDPDAEVIDLPTLDRIQKENASKRLERVGELIAAAEEVRAALDERVREHPDFMSIAGRDIWLVRSKIDVMVRNLQRKAA